MNSFISSFKAIFIAIGIIVIIEFACWCFAKPDTFNSINWFQYTYLKPENTTKLFLINKLQSAVDLKSQFLQVGDSSGLHGLNPKIIENDVPGVTYDNASLGADFGYLGHYNFAKTILTYDHDVKYLVLYVTPMAWPAYVHDEHRVLEKAVYSAFLSPWHHLAPPSLMFRNSLVSLVYYQKKEDTLYTTPAVFRTNNGKQFFNENRGFVPRDDYTAETQILPQGMCVFPEWFAPSKEGRKPIEFFYSSLEKMALLARDKKIKLIIVFNPVTCEEKAELGTLSIKRELARFRNNYPEVIIPFPFITTWPKDRFMDSWHLYKTAATIMSHRLAGELKKIITDPTYRGIPLQSMSEMDAQIDYAQKHPSRPPACNSFISTTDRSKQFTNCMGLTFITLTPQPFIMGSCQHKKNCVAGMRPDPDAFRDEYPAHLVRLKKTFQLSQSPVTIEQFNTFLHYYDGDNMDVHTANLQKDPDFIAANEGDPKRPITMVTWNDAMAYVAWLNKIKPASDTGWYRLPSEAEWEFAARGGKQTRYWWGDNMIHNQANISGFTDKTAQTPSPPGRYAANPYGLYDMNGNVWEWVKDCYHGWYSKKHADGRAYQAANCKIRVLRGGSAADSAVRARSAARFNFDAVGRSKTIGFRIVRVENRS